MVTLAEAFWQTVAEPLTLAVGVGRTVTVVEADADGPLQPLAVTLTVAVPEKLGSQVTVAVVAVPDILLPLPVTDQLYDVALVAEVVKSIVPLP